MKREFEPMVVPSVRQEGGSDIFISVPFIYLNMSPCQWKELKELNISGKILWVLACKSTYLTGLVNQVNYSSKLLGSHDIPLESALLPHPVLPSATLNFLTAYYIYSPYQNVEDSSLWLHFCSQ